MNLPWSLSDPGGNHEPKSSADLGSHPEVYGAYANNAPAFYFHRCEKQHAFRARTACSVDNRKRLVGDK
jgi:hypothetical protein